MDQVAKENEYQENLTRAQEQGEIDRKLKSQENIDDQNRMYENAWNFRLGLEKSGNDKIESAKKEIAALKEGNKTRELYRSGGQEAVIEYDISGLQSQLDILQAMEDTKTNSLEIEKIDLLIQQKKSELLDLQLTKQEDIKTAGANPVAGGIVAIGSQLLGAFVSSMGDDKKAIENQTDSLKENTRSVDRSTQALQDALEKYINVPTTFNWNDWAYLAKPGAIPRFAKGGYVAESGLAFVDRGEIITKYLTTPKNIYTNNEGSKGI